MRSPSHGPLALKQKDLPLPPLFPPSLPPSVSPSLRPSVPPCRLAAPVYKKSGPGTRARGARAGGRTRPGGRARRSRSGRLAAGGAGQASAAPRTSSGSTPGAHGPSRFRVTRGLSLGGPGAAGPAQTAPADGGRSRPSCSPRALASAGGLGHPTPLTALGLPRARTASPSAQRARQRPGAPRSTRALASAGSLGHPSSAIGPRPHSRPRRVAFGPAGPAAARRSSLTARARKRGQPWTPLLRYRPTASLAPAPRRLRPRGPGSGLTLLSPPRPPAHQIPLSPRRLPTPPLASTSASAPILTRARGGCLATNPSNRS